MSFWRRRRDYDWATNYGLTLTQIEALGTYNAEVARGLVHTDSFNERMATLQATYNRALMSRPLS